MLIRLHLYHPLARSSVLESALASQCCFSVLMNENHVHKNYFHFVLFFHIHHAQSLSLCLRLSMLVYVVTVPASIYTHTHTEIKMAGWLLLVFHFIFYTLHIKELKSLISDGADCKHTHSYLCFFYI